MPLPPLANLFAHYDPDPAALEAVLRDLQTSGEFAHVWQPAPGWVAAAAPLPGGIPDDERVYSQRLAFAEGRERVVDEASQPPLEALRRAADLAERHPDNLASLPGDFSFIHFGEHGSATVVRSCGGLVPFYLWRDGERCAIATRLGDLVRYLPDEFTPDPLVNAIWASSWGMFPEGRTFLVGVTLLERGHYANMGRGEVMPRPYWRPRPEHVPYPTQAQRREHAERLRALLVDKLTRDLDPDGGNLLTLSGGIDSSSLGALAAGVVGREVWTWSLLPAEDRPDLLQHELSFIEPLAQQFGFTRHWREHARARLLLDLWQEAPPVVFHILHPALCRLPALTREAPLRVLFGGEYADNVVGSVFNFPDWARQTSLLRLLLEPQVTLRHPRATLLRWAKLRWDALRGDDWLIFPRELLEMNLKSKAPLDIFHPDVRAEYLAWWDKQKQTLQRDRGPWRLLALESAAMAPFAPMNWEACSALGVRRSLPFYTREIFELTFACHPAELVGPETKKLLRAALKNDVPARNLNRLDKGGWGRFDPERLAPPPEALPAEPLPDEMLGVLNPAWLAHPPAQLDEAQQRILARLRIFAANLQTRRAARP